MFFACNSWCSQWKKYFFLALFYNVHIRRWVLNLKMKVVYISMSDLELIFFWHFWSCILGLLTLRWTTFPEISKMSLIGYETLVSLDLNHAFLRACTCVRHVENLTFVRKDLWFFTIFSHFSLNYWHILQKIMQKYVGSEKYCFIKT